MKKLLSVFICILMPGVLLFSQENVYKNPVIPGFYPDPSVCRNGEDYYLVTSSFEYFPGVPVFHSKDLIHWEQVGHCLTRKSQLPLERAHSSGGIYAPTIRYHNGTFYMVTTNVSGGGNFYVTTKDPAGDWSEPIWVKQSGIDPTIFFDDDGRVYFTSTSDKGIVLSQIDIETGTVKSDIKKIWGGTGGRYPEAPHIYKLNGWYYLMIAEGGTEYGHMVTISRSKNIWGPYESNPDNPILTHRGFSGMNSPIQGTGHADIIQAHDSSWWIVFLAFRPAEGTFHHLGRETFLMPLKWNQKGWPYVNDQDTASLTVSTKTLPVKKWGREEVRDNFDKDRLSFYWNFLRNPDENSYSLKEKPGFLTLKGSAVTLNDVASPAFIGRRQQHMNFISSASLNFESSGTNEESGLTVLMNETHHYDIFLTSDKGNYYVVLRYRIGKIIHEEKRMKIDKPKAILTVSATPKYYTFSFQSGEASQKVDMGAVEPKYLSSEVAGGFTGVYIGLYSTGNGKKCNSPAYFDWFDYLGKE